MAAGVGHAMLSSRELMDLALKATVVPVLRGSGFTGAYPHFRREYVTHVDLLTFQFDINGGGFLLEISRYGIGGITTQAGKHIPASKVRVWDLQPNDRIRIKPGEGSGKAGWFRYENSRYDEVANQVLATLPVAHDYWSRRV
jgi:hypothetical protein